MPAIGTHPDPSGLFGLGLPAAADRDREPFVCAHLCRGCGRLEAPEPAGRGDPCPSCGRSAWLDLGHRPTSVALRTLEGGLRALPPGSPPDSPPSSPLSSLASWLASWLWGLTALAIVTLERLTGWPASARLARLFARPWGRGRRASQARAQRSDQRHGRALAQAIADNPNAPLRHRLPLYTLPPDHAKAVQDRPAALPRATGARTRAPITATECVAWRVRATLCAQAQCQLVLDDSHSVPVALAGLGLETEIELPEDAVLAQAPIEHARALPLALMPLTAQARARRFLRERGFEPERGQWLFEEEFVPLGVPVHLRTDGAAPLVLSWTGGSSPAAGAPTR